MQIKTTKSNFKLEQKMYLHSDTPSFIIYAHIHDVRAKATFVNREYFMWPMFLYPHAAH